LVSIDVLPTLMIEWDRYVEKWFNVSPNSFTDYGFEKMKQEFDRIFDDDLDDDLNEVELSESYMEIRSETIREEVDILLTVPYTSNQRPNKKVGVGKNKRKSRSAYVQGRNHLNTDYYDFSDDDNISGSEIPLSRIEREGRGNSLEDVIVTDENIKIVMRLPINNRRENIKVVAYSDNSIALSYLNSEGIRCRYASIVPYNIDIETARSTYRNGILEITLRRK
jgi:hypothetical protein